VLCYIRLVLPSSDHVHKPMAVHVTEIHMAPIVKIKVWSQSYRHNYYRLRLLCVATSSTPEVMTLWHFINLFVIIIISGNSVCCSIGCSREGVSRVEFSMCWV